MSDLSSILIGSRRSFSTFIPHVVVSEQHRDDLVVTQHPVEHGATISDHAFKRPSSLEVRCGWSDSTEYDGYAQEVYEEVLGLQEEREPFDVVTGKRSYQNMLLTSIGVTTEAGTEKVLACTLVFQEIIITTTQSTSVSGQSQKSSSQAEPETTAPTADAGDKQPVQIATAPASSPTDYAPLQLGPGYQPGGGATASFGIGGPNTDTAGQNGITLPTPFDNQFGFTAKDPFS